MHQQQRDSTLEMRAMQQQPLAEQGQRHLSFSQIGAEAALSMPCTAATAGAAPARPSSTVQGTGEPAAVSSRPCSLQGIRRRPPCSSGSRLVRRQQQHLRWKEKQQHPSRGATRQASSSSSLGSQCDYCAKPSSSTSQKQQPQQQQQQQLSSAGTNDLPRSKGHGAPPKTQRKGGGLSSSSSISISGASFSPAADSPMPLGSSLTSWAASNAGHPHSSVHTPVASSRLRLKDFSLSPPRKKMHTATHRHHRNAAHKQPAVTAAPNAQAAAPAAGTPAVAPPCSPLQVQEPQRPRHQQQLLQESGSSRPAPPMAAPAAAIAGAPPPPLDEAQQGCRARICPVVASRGATLQHRRRNGRHLEQQQQPVQADPGQEGSKPSLGTRAQRQPPPQPQHLQQQHLQQQHHHQQQRQGRRNVWRPRAAGGLVGVEVDAQPAGICTSTPGHQLAAAARSSQPTLQGAPRRQHAGRRQQQQQQQQQPISLQQHQQPQQQPRRSPRSPLSQQQQQQQQMLLQLVNSRCDDAIEALCATERWDSAAAAAANATVDAASAAGVAAARESPATAVHMETAAAGGRRVGATRRSPAQQQQQQEQQQQREQALLLHRRQQDSQQQQLLLQQQIREQMQGQHKREEEDALLLRFCYSIFGGPSAQQAAIYPVAAVATPEESRSFFPWSLVPLGVQLLICYFLGDEELMALAAAGKAGREVTDHRHCWLLRCTRSLLPCLVAAATKTAALPFAFPYRDRKSFRCKWGLAEQQLLCLRAAAHAPASPPSAAAAAAAGQGGSDTVCLSRTNGGPYRRPQHSFKTTSSCSNSLHEVLWESWAHYNLNDEAYGFDYKRLFLDRNGWRPRGGAVPKWERTKREANPPFVNTMDARQQFGYLYLASERASKASTSSPEAQLQILSLRDLSAQRKTFVASKAINCLDVNEEVLVCGDDNGVLHIFNPFSLELKNKYAASGIPSVALVYSLRATQEINDLRVCGAENQILAVRTASRYPAGLDLVDIETGTRRAITPDKTDGHWIHAVDVDSRPFRCPYTSRSGVSGLPGCCCSAGGSSSLRNSSTSNVLAVGESSAAGSFALLRLDFRLDRPVVQQVPQTKRMLWPLRMDGHKAFVNAVFGPGDFLGRIHQVDMRMPVISPGYASSPSVGAPFASTDTSVAAPGGLLHLLPNKRVEDIRIHDGQVYVLANDDCGELRVLRFDSEVPKQAEMICPVDTFTAADWAEPLRLLLVYEQGWTATYGNYVTVGRMADPWSLTSHEKEPVVLPPLYNTIIADA